MSKKDYINAVNEIEVNEELKRKTLNKLKANQTKKVYNKIYPIASIAIMCAVILGITLPNKTIAPIKEVEYSEVQNTSKLPKVENFENLYAMLKQRANQNGTEEYIMKDSVELQINANKFAANLLMPEKEFEQQYNKYYNDIDLYAKLEEYFQVSRRAIDRRIIELGLN